MYKPAQEVRLCKLTGSKNNLNSVDWAVKLENK